MGEVDLGEPFSSMEMVKELTRGRGYRSLMVWAFRAR